MNPEVAEVVAGLVAERYRPSIRGPQFTRTYADALPAVTPEEADRNRRTLLEALAEEPVIELFGGAA